MMQRVGISPGNKISPDLFPYNEGDLEQRVTLRLEVLPDDDVRVFYSIPIEDGIDPTLVEKGLRARRRVETFARTNHLWRRNIGAAERNIYEKPKSGRPGNVGGLQIIVEDGSSLSRDYKNWGTNQILEHYGFAEGQERNNFLRHFNKDPSDRDTYCGVEVVRATFSLASSHGLNDYPRTPQERKGIFEAIGYFINEGNTRLADTLVKHFGLEHMPELMENFSVLRRMMALVPKNDLYSIVSAMRSSGPTGPRGSALLRELGYESIKADRIPILYQKPKARLIQV